MSNNISDWGTFGDFFGGTLNTLISGISLIVLGYLTHLVAKQSNEENKKNNLLLRKLDVFDELTSYQPELNIFIGDFIRFLNIINKDFKTPFLTPEKRLHYELELSKKNGFFIELYYYLYSFKNRYGHLFNYNFSSPEYVRLITNGEIMIKFFENNRTLLELKEVRDSEKLDDVELDVNTYEIFLGDLAIFIHKLRKELK